MNSPLREVRKRAKERAEQRSGMPPLASPEHPPPQRYNTVRITVNEPFLHIHGGTLDIDGIEKFQKALSFYEGLLLLSAEKQGLNGCDLRRENAAAPGGVLDADQE